MVTITKVKTYNPSKVYLIKRYRCGHYYMNQTIDGKIFYKRWLSTNKSHVEYLISTGPVTLS